MLPSLIIRVRGTLSSILGMVNEVLAKTFARNVVKANRYS